MQQQHLQHARGASGRMSAFCARPCALRVAACFGRPRLTRRTAQVVQARFSSNSRGSGGSFGGRSSFPVASSGPEIGDRLLAALPYVLPFFNAFTYGRYLFYM